LYLCVHTHTHTRSQTYTLTHTNTLTHTQHTHKHTHTHTHTQHTCTNARTHTHTCRERPSCWCNWHSRLCMPLQAVAQHALSPVSAGLHSTACTAAVVPIQHLVTAMPQRCTFLPSAKLRCAIWTACFRAPFALRPPLRLVYFQRWG